MAIKSTGGLDDAASRFTADSAEETMRELEDQYARGEIDRNAYFIKKRSLVRLYLKATTAPKRRYDDEWDGE